MTGPQQNMPLSNKRFIKPLVFLILSLPALYYFYAVWLAFTGAGNLLGADPPKELALATGTWAIRSLILALAITPLRYLLNMPVLWQYRRMVGLFALFYTSMHFLVFLMFILQWDWAGLGVEIAERPYVTVGFTAFVLMLALGATSFQKAQRLMKRNWKRLHRFVYVINMLAVLHVTWIVRSDFGEALLYGVLVATLLGYRLLRHYIPAVKNFGLHKPRPLVKPSSSS